MFDFLAEHLLLIILVVNFCLYYTFKIVIRSRRRPKNYPPGPLGLPYFGNSLLFVREPAKRFLELRKDYGDILGLTIGKHRLVVLNNYADIKEAFSQNSFAGRPRISPFLAKCRGERLRGILSNDGPDGIDQRKFAIKSLRELGFEKSRIEHAVKIEIADLMQSLDSCIEKPISLVGRFHVAIANPLWSLITGQRYAHDDPEFKELTNKLRLIFEGTPTLGLTLFYPALEKYAPEFLVGKPRSIRDEMVKDFASKIIESHKKLFSADVEPTNFIDAYLHKIHKTNDENSCFYKDEGEKNLIVSIIDLVGTAGMESTAQALTWAFLYLSMHSDVQQSLFNEISHVVGLCRLPGLEDRQKMPYTEAALHEILRCSSILPITAIHRTTQPVTFHKYTIPANTMVVGNIYACDQDPSIWTDPIAFNPTRFLSSSKSAYDAFLSFSTGKRACLGEKLSMDTLFLFLSCLVQKYTITPSPDHEKPNPDNVYKSIINIPKPFKIVLNHRN